MWTGAAIEPVLPIHQEAEEADVELPGLLDAEDAEDRNGH
jgi:hypothetical protein